MKLSVMPNLSGMPADTDPDDEDDLVEDSTETSGLFRSPTSARSKKTCVGKHSARPSTASRPIDNRIHLERHKKERNKDEKVQELIRNGIKQNRFCTKLDDEDLNAIIETMEYFSFDAGEHVVRQGHVGYYFFVTQDGEFEVSKNEKIVNELSSGTAFGAIALVYACPRTATVTAKDDGSTVWGADADTFHRILLANTRKHSEENRQFLDGISLFASLEEDQKDRIEKIALFVESFSAGAMVVSEGQLPSAIYFVKRGELSVYKGGSFDSSGRLQGGEKLAQLKVGDRFGTRSALHEEPRTTTVIAETDCELLCVGIRQLHEVLGGHIADCLERSLIAQVLKQLPLINHLSVRQQHEIVYAMEFKDCPPGAAVQGEGQEGMQLAIVIDGEATSSVRGTSVTIERGQWCGDDAFSQAEATLQADSLDSSGCSTISSLVAGPKGARLALLSTQALIEALKMLGLSAIGGSSEALQYMRQILCAKKVAIFRELSTEQINSFVSSFVLKQYTTGAVVIRQGEIGTDFFIISRGSVDVLVDDHNVRNLGVNSCFGERALIFNERRSASIVAAADDTQLWCISQVAFRDVVSENMRQELEHKIKLQDTSVSMKLIVHVRLIGAGAFGSVRLVEHKFTRLKYALKRIKKIDDKIPSEVTTECNLLSEIDHPFIVALVRTFYTKSSIYILTELISGGELHQQLGKMGVLNRKQTQFYVGSLVLILEYLHDRHIVYRDLKPENVMLDMQGYLKLVDFGLAKKMTAAKTFTVAGTLLYMAPEIFLGHGYGISVDIWSVGCMFFEFVCGHLPFGDELGDNEEGALVTAILGDDLTFPSKYNDSAGKKLIQGMLNKEPEHRLGGGINSFSDIKTNKYFKQGVSGDLFSKLIGRELDAPVVPLDEHYSDEKSLDATTSLSDAGELGQDV